MSKPAAKSMPLSGWRVLITRASGQAPALAEPLQQKGAEVLEVPTIEIHPPASYAPLDQALAEIAAYDTLILTSVNGVRSLFDRCRKLGLPPAGLRHLTTVAIGPATAQAMEREGIAVSIVPKRYVAESVVEALRGRISSSSRVLLVRAKVARDILPAELRKMGGRVHVIEAYETRVPKAAARKLKEIFLQPEIRPHVVTFTSSSTAANFLDLLGPEARSSLRDLCLASIGPVTTATLREAGFEPRVQARTYTMAGLVDGITAYAATKRNLS
jgi:uroporphyrinogen-III synthase